VRNTVSIQLNWGHGLCAQSKAALQDLKAKESTAAVLVLPDVILSINPFWNQFALRVNEVFSVFFYLLVVTV